MNDVTDCVRTRPTVAVVVPCFNEALALPHAIAVLTATIQTMMGNHLASASSFLVFVDDGSRDDTWHVIAQANVRQADDVGAGGVKVVGARLARNAGHQAALMAGMRVAVLAAADVVVTIDADLQDDPGVIPEMVRLVASGNAEAALGVRRSRDSDSAFKRGTARGFYRLMRAMGVDLVVDHADFRAMSRSVTQRLIELPERNLFLRAAVPQVTSRVAHVLYDRSPRVAGETKYPLAKMLSFAWKGITANSTTPLRVVFMVGLASIALASVGFLYATIGWVRGDTVPGWVSLFSIQLVLGGMVLLAQGILGEYLARIYVETKRRPHAYVDEVVGIESTVLGGEHAHGL